MMTSGPGDSWVQSVRDLSELPSDNPATNVALDRSVVRFDSLYVAGPHGLTKKAVMWMMPRTALTILLILFAVVSMWLFVRACEQSSRIAVQTGAMTWRFN
jgi:hypothetical protein